MVSLLRVETTRDCSLGTSKISCYLGSGLSRQSRRL